MAANGNVGEAKHAESVKAFGDAKASAAASKSNLKISGEVELASEANQMRLLAEKCQMRESYGNINLRAASAAKISAVAHNGVQIMA